MSKINKRKYIALGSAQRINVSGFKHLLPLYRDAINQINETENNRMFQQLASREAVDCTDEFIERMNKDSAYRTEILRKYKIE